MSHLHHCLCSRRERHTERPHFGLGQESKKRNEIGEMGRKNEANSRRVKKR